MKKITLATTTAILLALAACGGPEDAPAEPDEAATTDQAETGDMDTEGDAGETDGASVDPVDQAAAETVDALQLIKLDCGEIYVNDLSIFSVEGDYDGETDTFVDTCWLIRHPEGDLLWDLGLPGALTSEGEMSQGPFTVSLEQTIGEQLENMDIGLSDIEYLALSHSHFDHTGQIDQIDPEMTTWLVNELEYDHMFSAGEDSDAADDNADAESADASAEDGSSSEGDEQTSESSDEAPNQFSAFELLEHEIVLDNHDVFGDGSVVMFMTPGHTPGHSSLLVNLPETGPVMLTGDLWHMEESRENARVPAFNTSVERTRQSMQEFEDRAEELGAKVIIQHEPADTEDLPDVMR